MMEALAQVRTVPLDIDPGANGWPSDLFKNLNEHADL
jgi:hypothetical protein